MKVLNRSARLAGLFYLLFMITIIPAGAIRDQLVVYGDAAATAAKVLAAPWLFRLDVVMDVASGVFFLLAAWALYALLKSVNADLALAVVLLNLGGVAVQSVSLLSQFAALLVLSGPAYLSVFPAEQMRALAMLFLDLYKNGFLIAQIFYGAWLLPLGYLVYKSGFLPKWLGVLLMLDFAGVMIWFLQFFLLPGLDVITYPGLAVSFVAESSLTLWLLIKGAQDVPSPLRGHLPEPSL